MYQVMKLEDIVSANAKAMVKFMNVTDFRFFILSAAIAIGTYGLYLQDKEIKKLEKKCETLSEMVDGHRYRIDRFGDRLNFYGVELDRVRREMKTEEQSDEKES